MPTPAVTAKQACVGLAGNASHQHDNRREAQHRSKYIATHRSYLQNSKPRSFLTFQSWPPFHRFTRRCKTNNIDGAVVHALANTPAAVSLAQTCCATHARAWLPTLCRCVGCSCRPSTTTAGNASASSVPLRRKSAQPDRRSSCRAATCFTSAIMRIRTVLHHKQPQRDQYSAKTPFSKVAHSVPSLFPFATGGGIRSVTSARPQTSTAARPRLASRSIYEPTRSISTSHLNPAEWKKFVC